MKRTDEQIMDVFKRHYDRAQRDPSDIEQASQTVWAQYMARYPHLIPQFKAHILEIFNLYNPPEEGDRKIQGRLLEAYTWNAFSSTTDALRELLTDDEFEEGRITTVHDRMLLMGTYDTFEVEYNNLIKEFSHEKPKETENQTKA